MGNNRRRLLALDPGESTGWSLWWYDDHTALTLIARGTVTGGVTGFVEWWHQNLIDPDGPPGAHRWDEIVCEQFLLDGRTARPNVTPLLIEGALTALWGRVAFQPNTYKGQVPDAKIRAMGLWWPGKGHDRDSLRHAFAFMRGKRHIPTLIALNPPKPLLVDGDDPM